MPSEQLVIFSDMDGTLLDHKSYQFDAAKPWLKKLKVLGIPVILNTSKTRAEVEKWSYENNSDYPFVVENGAAILIPKSQSKTQPVGSISSAQYWLKSFVKPRAHWRSLIDSVAEEYAGQLATFSQLGIEGISKLTGLSAEDAELASQRQYGEPVAWLTEHDPERFIQQLQQLGANVLRGGRFIHISGQCNKGMAMNYITSFYQQNFPERHWVTLALGDSHNDVAMLESADYAGIVAQHSGKPLQLSRSKNLFRSKLCAPDGWVEIVEKTLSHLNIN